MIFKAVVSSKAHPEYGQAAISFPIPDDQYDSIIKLLEAMDIGSPILQDCRVDEISSGYPILDRLVGQGINVDELDFVGASFISLASASGESSLISLLLLPKSKPLRWVSIWLPFKRLESFCHSEAAQFQAMAFQLSLSDIKDYINLTFCCQQATVITDFSDLEQVGKDHSLTINGGSMPMEKFKQVDGLAVALDLIKSGAGIVTPYGVVFDNGMRLEQLYDGRHFPAYLYQMPELMIEIRSGEGGDATGYLYLPSSDRQIQRTLTRAGSGSEGFRMEIAMDELPPQISAVIDLTCDGLDDLNALCRTIKPLNTEQRERLEAAVLLARPQYASEVRQLAEIWGPRASPAEGGSRGERRSSEMSELCRLRRSERYGACDNADQFDFVPKPDSPVADSALTELGYVAYHGSLTLKELLTDAPTEQHQWEQRMGGI